MKKREHILITLYFLLLIVIILNLGIHVYRTVRFNNKERTIKAGEVTENCFFDLHFRGGATDSWLKRDVEVYDSICTLKGTTFDGVFYNESMFEISDWKLKINITNNCFLNNCWCGTVEVHQKDNSQILDLRNVKREDVVLDYIDVGQDFMIPLEKGDYIIYTPSLEADEIPVRAFNGNPGSVTIGMILYTDVSEDFNISDYSVSFRFNKKIMQGTEAVIFVVLFALCCFILIIQATVHLAYRSAEKDAERRINLQRMEDMKEYNAKLNAEVESKTFHIKEIQQKVVVGLANVIGNRDPDTGGHVKRTSDIIKILINEFRKQNPDLLDDEKAYDIYRSAPMHDLGKIYIESSILCKPGKLTDEEYAIMKKHSTNSGEIVKLILKDVEEPHFVETAFNVARYHHERWDGKGYPDQLAGEAIPLEARIMAVADVYDALVSRRCYKQSMSFDKAFEIMCQGMGSQFDPQMKSVFIACREDLERYYTLNNK